MSTCIAVVWCAAAHERDGSGESSGKPSHMRRCHLQTDKFMREWLGRFNHNAADDIWEQAEFNQILKGAHATMPQLKWDKLDEEWFVDL